MLWLRSLFSLSVLFCAAFAIQANGQTPPARSAKDIPLLAATLLGDVESVANLLAGGADPDAYDAQRNTALIYAARDGTTEIVRVLVEAGADPGWVDGERVTPLILAAYRGHLEIVKLLLRRNVDRSHRDQWGRSALDYGPTTWPSGPYCGPAARAVATSKTALVVEETPQGLAAARMAKFANRFRFDLTNAFAGNREGDADFFQRVIGIHADAEPHAQYPFLARG